MGVMISIFESLLGDGTRRVHIGARLGNGVNDEFASRLQPKAFWGNGSPPVAHKWQD